MTVDELIEELSKFDGSLKVLKRYWGDGPCHGYGGDYEKDEVSDVFPSQEWLGDKVQPGPRGGKPRMRSTYGDVVVID